MNAAAPPPPPPTPVAEPMRKVDVAWLRMDSPSNLMMIVGVWLLRPAVSLPALRARVQQRLLAYPRFGQRVQWDAHGASWVADADFDLGRHVVQEEVPGAHRQDARGWLQERLGVLAMQPLDLRHPPWELRLVQHYAGGSALVARIHHCVADGLALIAVMQSLVDEGQRPPAADPAPPPPPHGSAPQEWMQHALIEPITAAAVRALQAAGAGAAQVLAALAQPRQAWQDAWHQGWGTLGHAYWEAARLAGQMMRDGAGLALMPNDSPTRFKGQPGRAKRVAWCEPLPLDEVRAVAKALHCSINDVLLSCVAGALGAHLRSLGDAVDGQEIRAMVPVNLRPPQQAHQLGNHFGLAPVVLPIGQRHPLRRLFAVRRRMQDLKSSLQPWLAFALLSLAGRVVKPAQDALLEVFSRKTTAVMTNVPGPREKLHLCGSRLEQTLFWVPQTGTVGLGVSILSYGGGVQFGLMGDTTLCPDPQAIIDRFEPEFDQLRWLALMLPWGDELPD